MNLKEIEALIDSRTTSWLDHFAPRYDVAARHQTKVYAPAKNVYAAIRKLDLSRSAIVRTLFRLRGMPLECLTLDGLLKTGFVLLAEVPDRELVLGLAGRFWSLSGELQNVSADSFRSFDEAGYAKAVWNFSLEPLGENVTRLTTETRVTCLDSASRRSFKFYWSFVKPFSGVVRKETLRLIKQAAEQTLNHS
ncbi:MAG: hypothetical protein ACR2LC_13745 [Pyrinomonadaceae bacterium]